MKRILWLVLLVLALPLAAFADSGVDFTNTGGTLSGGNAGLSLNGSALKIVSGVGGLGEVTGNLGNIMFSTGMLTGGNLDGTCANVCVIATFAGGGSYVVTGNGTGGLPNGVIFSGTFQGPVTLVLSNGTHQYFLIGTVSGTLYNGTQLLGVTNQTTISIGKGSLSELLGEDNGVGVTSGENSFSVVPEPGSLTLMGTGLVGLAGILRRKFKA